MAELFRAIPQTDVPDGFCPVCTKELDDNGWCFECRAIALAQCRLCEVAHGHPLPRMLVVSPANLLHIVTDSGLTLCGHDATGWVWKDTDGAR